MDAADESEFAQFKLSLLAKDKPVKSETHKTTTVASQDEQLEKLLVSVQRQKEIARCINSELDIQNSLAEEISASAQKSGEKVTKQKSSLEEIRKRFL